jgi:hypothetical protein
MNTTLNTILKQTVTILSLITLFAFLVLTHPIVVHVLADEIVPVR